MPIVEERLANLEGRVNEHTQTFLLLRDAVASLERRMDRFEIHTDSRFDALDDKMSKGFAWMVALFITSTIAIISTILTRG